MIAISGWRRCYCLYTFKNTLHTILRHNSWRKWVISWHLYHGSAKSIQRFELSKNCSFLYHLTEKLRTDWYFPRYVNGVHPNIPTGIPQGILRKSLWIFHKETQGIPWGILREISSRVTQEITSDIPQEISPENPQKLPQEIP